MWRWHRMLCGRNPACTRSGQRSARVVVPLVVVHLLDRTEPQPKGRELEEPLATPIGNVHEADPAGTQNPTKFLERDLRLPQMLQHRHAQHDVQRVIRQCPARRPVAPPPEPSLFGWRLQVVAEGNIDQRHRLDFIDDASRKGGIESATDVRDTLAAAGSPSAAGSCDRTTRLRTCRPVKARCAVQRHDSRSVSWIFHARAPV